MKAKILLGLLLLLPGKASMAMDIGVELTAEPSLPVENLICDSSFEDAAGKETFWSVGAFYKGKGELKLVEDESHSGGKSLRISGFTSDAAGEVCSKTLKIYTDIPYCLDFWVKTCREMPSAGLVSLRCVSYKAGGSADAQINPLLKIPDTWVRFSAPPLDIAAQTLVLSWRPREADQPGTYEANYSNVINFGKNNFGHLDQIQARLYIIASGIGIVWYDDILLRPLKTKLKCSVKGHGVREILILNDGKEVVGKQVFTDDWPGEYTRVITVPTDSAYHVEIKTSSGGKVHAQYPKRNGD